MDNYSAPNQNQIRRNITSRQFVNAAFILGIISLPIGIFLFWTPFVIIAFIGGGLSILFAVLSKGNQTRMQTKAKVGLILGSIGSILSIALLVGTLVGSIYLLRNDPEIRAITRESVVAYEETIDSLYGEDFFEAYEETYGREFDLGASFDEYFGE